MVHKLSGLEVPDPNGEAPSNEPDTGADVQQTGEFQGAY
jgi:hypothetical protein